MKKYLILVMTFSLGLGYWLFTNLAGASEAHASPLIGKWAPDEKEFIRQARQKGITPQQEGVMRDYLAHTRITIRQNGSINFKFPEKSGVFAYESVRADNGCHEMHIAKVGNYMACVSGRSMTLHDEESGTVEHYRRI